MAEKTKTKTDLGFQAQKFILENNIAQQCLGWSNHTRNAIKDSFPDKKYYEFAWHMFFSNKFDGLQQEWENWLPWDIWDWPVYDLNRYKTIISNNRSIINDRNVLDIGCSLGYLSLISLHYGCKNVTGIDARQDKLALADFISRQAGYKNFTFKRVDLHSPEFIEVSKNIDTVILPAVLHHVPNHYGILSKITSSDASHLILDNAESEKFYRDPTPQIDWTTEHTDDHMNAYSPYKKSAMVGIPNQAWINLAMEDLGWKLEKDCDYYMMDKKHWPRCCSVWKR
jgi:SAM-dependent methyltransferase